MSEQPGTVSLSRIPIRNIWFLLAYAAADELKLSKAQTGAEDLTEDLPDLVAKLLVEETNKRIWGNLSINYHQNSSELSRLRGKISHIQTARRDSFARGKIYCKYDEITLNTLENKMVRTALAVAKSLVQDKRLAQTCRALESRIASLGIELLPSQTSIAKLRRLPSNPRDARMCSLALLILQFEIPTQGAGTRKLYSPQITEGWLRLIFEKAVLGFYTYHLADLGWKIQGGRRLSWYKEEASEGLDAILPSMKTDIELVEPISGRITVIDTKFTNVLTKGQYGQDSLKSGYIYQLYTYLRSQEKQEISQTLNSTGMLLHPTIDTSLYEEVLIQGHRFRFATINLMSHPRDLTTDLLNLVLEVRNE